MTKKQTWEAVEALLGNYPNVSKKLKTELADLLKPKGSRGSSNPAVLNEDGTIKEAWCRYHQRYEPAEDMILYDNNTKSKGLCKAASREWHKRNSAVKSMEAEATELLISGDAEAAMTKAKEAKETKEALNTPESYDYDADWAEFDKAMKAKGEDNAEG
jgi:hypothetical protein